MTDSIGDHVTWPPPADNTHMPDRGGTWSAWAVRLTRRSDGEETFVDCDDSSEAHEQADEVRGFADTLDIEIVSRIATALPWQPTEGEAPSAAQLADLINMAAASLRQLAARGLLTSADAAEIPGKLQVALDHIGETISSDVVRDALPEAAKHLDVAAARSMRAAHLIRLAEPAKGGRRPADRRPVDFPGDVKPSVPGGRGTPASPSPGAAAVTKGARPS